MLEQVVLPLLDRHPSVDSDRLAGNIARRLRCEKDDRSLQLALVPDARDDIVFLDPPLINVDHSVSKPRMKKSRSDRVHTDSATAPTRRQLARQPDQARLTRYVPGIERPVSRRCEAGDRRNVYDRSAALFEHLPPRRLRHQETARQVYVDHLLPL